MSFAKTIATKTIRKAQHSRVASRVCTIECRRGKATTAMPHPLSMESAANANIPPLAEELRMMLRQFHTENQELKGRLTIEEVRSALEPITRAREQAVPIQKSIPKLEKNKPLRL